MQFVVVHLSAQQARQIGELRRSARKRSAGGTGDGAGWLRKARYDVFLKAVEFSGIKSAVIFEWHPVLQHFFD